MTVETATQISQLNATLPLGSDPKSEGDNHLRLIKLVLQDVFNDATTGIMQLVLQHVKAGLLAATKQGIEIDDAGDGARLRLSTDVTSALGNGLIELYDNAHAIARTMKITPAGADGDLLTTGNAMYKGAVVANLDFPIGSVVAAQTGLINYNCNSAQDVRTASAFSYTIGGGGSSLIGTWVVRGSMGTSTAVFYLCQRIS